MAQVACPSCGKLNSDTEEFCKFCQARLVPPTDPQNNLDPFTGETPSGKAVKESEPMLPNWLREARQQVSGSNLGNTRLGINKGRHGEDSQDLLAGLRSQANQEDEEVPDWLAKITGAGSDKKSGSKESSEVRWTGQGGGQEGPARPSQGISATTSPRDLPAEEAKKERDSLPGWLAELQSGADQGRDELSEWLSQASMETDHVLPTGAFDDPESQAFHEKEGGENAAGWLTDLQAEFIESGLPSSGLPFKQEPPVQPADSALDSPRGTASSLSDEEWLARLTAGQPESPPAPQPSNEKTPPWLREQNQSGGLAAQGDLPDWLRAAAPKSTFEEPGSPTENSGSKEIPEWLRSETIDQVNLEAEIPFPAAGAESEIRSGVEGSQVTPAEAPESTEKGTQAFVTDALTNGDMDSLFSELPDWISKPDVNESPERSAGNLGSVPEGIAPVNLPSWVQAMRPMDSTPSQGSIPGNALFEGQGALAGLQDVLPSIPGTEASSKPGTFTVKLKASEEQQAHAALLEKVLAAELTPRPMLTLQSISIQRMLGWVISAVLILVVTGMLGIGVQYFRLPVAWPASIVAALQTVESVSENAPVLVVVDYEAARLGEMEAASIPLLDHMILLRHPRLTFTSTNPEGGLLAERLISDSFLGGHQYLPGSQYANLGYLPGGLTGVAAFAQSPGNTQSLDFNHAPAWSSPVLEGVNRLSDFSTLIILTDSADSARTWIEQTGPYRGAAPIVIAASAQAGPMIQPYYDSHQVAGLVTGLSGAAILEQNNASRPGIARAWWDAYSFSLILAGSMIAMGAAWNLFEGYRSRMTGKLN